MHLSTVLRVAGIGLVMSAFLKDRTNSSALLPEEAATPQQHVHRATPVFKLLEQAPNAAASKGSAGADEDEPTEEPRDYDMGVRLPPTFIACIGLVFSCVLGLFCCVVPRLDGVTLGIAGTLEQRWKESSTET
eukprot:Skav206047  [mRNA]  locus=scaffold587:238975:260073:+ [translate_table: standard]